MDNPLFHRTKLGRKGGRESTLVFTVLSHVQGFVCGFSVLFHLTNPIQSHTGLITKVLH